MKSRMMIGALVVSLAMSIAIAGEERDLAGGETQRHRIDLAAGEYIHVRIEQRGIDIVAALLGPDGNTVIEMDGITALLGAEELSCESASGGAYTLQVKAKSKTANPGRYEVNIEKHDAATASDRARIAAERLLMEGKRAQSEGGGDALQRAITKYDAAVENWQIAGDRKWEALTLHSLGIAHRDLGEYEKAGEFHERSLSITREIKDRQGEGAALNGLGVVNEKMGYYEKAAGYFEQSLVITREIRNRRGEGVTLNNLGAVYESLSEYEKARDSYEQSLAIAREIKNKFGEGVTLGNLGEVYRGLHDYEKAKDYFEQSLAIAREIEDREGEGLALNNLGAVYGNLGQSKRAGDYYEQSLAIARELDDKRGQGLTLHNLAEVYKDLNENAKAKDHYAQALAIRREIKDREGEATTLNSLGAVYARLGDYKEARNLYEQALTIRREIKDGGSEASTLLALASLERDHGDLAEARRRIESALAITESLRARYVDQEVRAAYFATAQDSYEFYIDLLMRLHKQDPAAGHVAAALNVSERARARSLLDTLAEAGADIRQGVDAQLLERERQLQEQLNAKAQRQTQLLGGDHRAEEAAALRKEIDAILTQFQEVHARIRATSPRYAALTQPVPLTLAEIQRQVLDDDTVLLEYALGEARSYLWAVTPASITSFELPARSEIDAAARRAYDLLMISHRRESKRGAEIAASDLSRIILNPAAAQLRRKRLLIVAEGALQYIPFGALSISGSDRPLIADHEIVMLPSASALAVLRRELGGRAAAPKTVAVLADPIFQRDDPRVNQRVVEAPDERPVADVTRSAKESGIAAFERLRFTRQEADSIVAQADKRATLKALDFDASRATVVSAGLDQYRIVHFATHGLLNSQHPELSGIVLSLVDKQGRPQDGFLRAHDIYNLKLRADLAVLSACQTALGKEIKGEGLAGLTRGFMYAGAASVVASLWDVKDEATAELMRRFYRKMLRDDMRPAAALRAAQISMRNEPRWGAPYYWAGFTIQGEWR